MGTDRVIRSRIPTVSDGIDDSSDAAGGIPVGLFDSRVGQAVVDPHGIPRLPVSRGKLGGIDRSGNRSGGTFSLGLLFPDRIDGVLPVVVPSQIFARRELSGFGFGGLFPGLSVLFTDCDDRVSGVGKFGLVPLGCFAISPNWGRQVLTSFGFRRRRSGFGEADNMGGVLLTLGRIVHD